MPDIHQVLVQIIHKVLVICQVLVIRQVLVILQVQVTHQVLAILLVPWDIPQAKMFTLKDHLVILQDLVVTLLDQESLILVIRQVLDILQDQVIQVVCLDIHLHLVILQFLTIHQMSQAICILRECQDRVLILVTQWDIHHNKLMDHNKMDHHHLICLQMVLQIAVHLCHKVKKI